MFTFQQNKSAECQPCPVEVFKSLTQAQLTAETINEHRRLKTCGKLKEAREKKDSLPGCLYQTKEVLISEGQSKFNKGKMGRWRLQSQCILNGLVMCDFDHVGSEKLKVKSEEFSSETFQTKAQELGILLAFITPGGDGLKVVFKADINFNLVDNQLAMAKKLGLEVTIDSGCKDSSRLSYVPKWDEILYINEEELFSYDNPAYDEKYGKAYREGKSDSKQGTVPSAESNLMLGSDPSIELELEKNEEGVYCYHGVPYTQLLAKWWDLKGGKPGIGDRHQRMLELAGELRRIMDNRPQNVFWLMQQTDVFDELVKEGRLQELEKMATDACEYRPRGAMSDELAQTLDSFGIKYTKKDTVQNNLPYDDWADRLMQLPLGCYEPALAHIDNPRVKPGGVISASGMYSVLLTRCNYQNWRGNMQRLNSLVLMEGDPASGKSLAKEQDDHIMQQSPEGRSPAGAWWHHPL